jgi:hypothetical protein
MARPHTAGIDIGAMEIFAGVAPELDSKPVPRRKEKVK